MMKCLTRFKKEQTEILTKNIFESTTLYPRDCLFISEKDNPYAEKGPRKKFRPST